jgi:ATP-dependent protease Clp ATPase subunit
MVDLMYDLPEQPKPGKYVIDKKIVENKSEFFLPKLRKESA